MNNLFEKLSSALSPLVLLISRVVIGYLILLHGLQKLMGVGGLIETVGGALIILGLFTRASAFLLAGQMTVAYLMFHATAETFFNPIVNQGEPAVLFAMAFLFIFVTGAGKFSLDAKITK